MTEFSEFFRDAVPLAEERSEERRFKFIAWNLWREGAKADHYFAEKYDRWAEEFDWSLRGAPSWITLKLVERTLSVLQPRYTTPLTVEDAIDILDRVGRLADVLKWTR